MQITVSTTLRKGGISSKISRANNISHRALVLLWKKAVRAYVRAAVSRMRDDTGMSKASLIPLAREVGLLTEISGSIRRRVSSRRGAFDISGKWNRSAIRSVGAGLKSSKRKAGYDLQIGHPKRPVFEFEFEITVWQHLMRERGIGAGGRWNSIEAGRKAFLQTLNKDFNSFVKKDLNIKNWLSGGS